MARARVWALAAPVTLGLGLAASSCCFGGGEEAAAGGGGGEGPGGGGPTPTQIAAPPANASAVR